VHDALGPAPCGFAKFQHHGGKMKTRTSFCHCTCNSQCRVRVKFDESKNAHVLEVNKHELEQCFHKNKKGEKKNSFFGEGAGLLSVRKCTLQRFSGGQHDLKLPTAHI
jgi:hypothetical protein